MDWQQLVALAIVAITATFFSRHWLRPKKLALQRNSPCGCHSPGHGDGPKQSIIFHARKGERPQIIVKSSR
jgi:hypothetical protein